MTEASVCLLFCACHLQLFTRLHGCIVCLFTLSRLVRHNAIVGRLAVSVLSGHGLQVVPMEELNLHLTGDIHAVAAATNLLAAALDARMFHEAAQSDAALLKRLCPVGKDGKRKIADVLMKRLERLKLAKDVDDLSAEELKR